MSLAASFNHHIQTLQSRYEETLKLLRAEGIEIEAVVLHSGSEDIYYADDQHIPFRAHAHFLHWVPVNRPDQMVLIQPGKKPRFFQVVPDDFWYDQSVDTQTWWADNFEIVRLSRPDQVMDYLPSLRRIAFLGRETAFASELGLPSSLHNETHLKNRLDYYRSLKTDYEVSRVEAANRVALKGHAAARSVFQQHGSEWQIHMAFLQACGMTEHESPYTNIVALDEKSAILHYQYKRTDPGSDSRVLLIDAGATVNYFCSDITRTYARESVHETFRALIDEVQRLKLALIDDVQVGVSYTSLHEKAHESVLDILVRHEICHGSLDELRDDKISALFFPHGVGHLLGIQVHDVSGHFKDETGILAPPPEEHKFLRLTRKMEPGMVFTIEPGIYFIPSLLEPERDTPRGRKLNWDLIDTLTPLGGIRDEDNILVTANGPRNLTAA